MEKLNDYLQNLVSTYGTELLLEPNKPPFVVTSEGVNELSNTPILGTQISMMIFPLIPNDVKQQLPNQHEIGFVLPHNLGNFNFLIKKSPAGFIVSVKPQNLSAEGLRLSTQSSSQLENVIAQNTPPPIISQESNGGNIPPTITFNQQVSPTQNQDNPPIDFGAIPSPFAQNTHETTFSESKPANLSAGENTFTAKIETQMFANEPQVFEFESASMAHTEPEIIYQSPDLDLDESFDDFELSIPQIQTAHVNDPEFITQFTNSSTYEEPGNKYDYEVEVIPDAYVPEKNVVEDFQPPQSYKPLEVSQPAFQVETEVQPEPEIEIMQPVQPLQQTAPIPQTYNPPVAQPVVSAPVVNSQARSRIDDLFHKMAAAKASDLHLSVSTKPMIRKDGKMSPLECNEQTLTPEIARELLHSIMPAKNREEFEERHDTDFAYEIKGLARFRANVFMDRKGMGGVFRIIPSKILTAEELNLSKAIMDLCNLSKGLVVVTGPTGSGKSTTLCAMVDSINKQREDHIITIEDPIEFTHENQKCLVNQREVHNHTDSFKDALRAALREDPDILLVGEMRDLETISIAIETAETGHLVFGTLHTTTAASTIDRIIDQFPADRQQQIRVMLSESLKGVIAQTLLPKKGGGRVAALEILIVTPAISNLIREGKTFQIASAMQTGRNLGMVMLNDALFAHVQSGAVEPRDAYIKAQDKTGFEALLTKNGFKI